MRVQASPFPVLLSSPGASYNPCFALGQTDISLLGSLGKGL